LTSVTIFAPELESYGYAFYGNGEDRKIYVYSDCVDTYKEHAEDMEVDANDILPIEGINLKDNADNRSLIAAANGYILNVTLQGRTLYKDGAWNTLCLPFDVVLERSPLDGATAMTLNASTSGFNASTGELTLTFDAVTSGTIAAGTPFIVKWTGTDVTDPVFSGVTVSNTAAGSVVSTDGNVRFQGTYSPAMIYSAAHDNLYLGDGNTLYYPDTEGFTLGAFRAYFHVDLTKPSDGPGEVRSFILNFGEGSEETGIVSVSKESGSEGVAGAWYTLDGVRLNGMPTRKGVYIHGGRLVVVP
jgi:hypothetical protein